MDHERLEMSSIAEGGVEDMCVLCKRRVHYKGATLILFLSCTRRLRNRINRLVRPGHVRFFPGLYKFTYPSYLLFGDYQFNGHLN